MISNPRKDAAHARPSAVRRFGIEEARRRIGQKLDEALAAVPKSGAPVGTWLEAALTRALGATISSTHASSDPSARESFMVRAG